MRDRKALLSEEEGQEPTSLGGVGKQLFQSCPLSGAHSCPTYRLGSWQALSASCGIHCSGGRCATSCCLRGAGASLGGCRRPCALWGVHQHRRPRPAEWPAAETRALGGLLREVRGVRPLAGPAGTQCPTLAPSSRAAEPQHTGRRTRACAVFRAGGDPRELRSVVRGCPTGLVSEIKTESFRLLMNPSSNGSSMPVTR